MARFHRIDEDNPGMIPAGGNIVLSPHGVAKGGVSELLDGIARCQSYKRLGTSS